MYKNLFRIAFLFIAGVCITACSSGDDDIADNTTPGTPGSKENVVILTGTIGAGSEMTRALGTDGQTVSWKVNDAIAVHYQKTDDNWATVEGTITSLDDYNTAKFTAKLTDPKSTSGIGLAYPYEHVSTDTFDDTDADALDFDYSCLYSQGGTTTTITNSKQDLAKTEDTDITISISGGAATLNKTAILKNQVCICKFNLKMGAKASGTGIDYANYYASSITVTDKSYTPNAVYTVENRDVVSNNLIKTNTFYVAMRKTDTTPAAISIRTTTGSGLTSGEDLNPSAVSVGQIIGVDHADGKAKTYTLTNNATVTINYSNVNLAKGKFYEKDVLIGENITPIAVIAHVGQVTNYCNNFIALALEDVETGGTVSQSDPTAQAAVTNWINNHNVTIGTTTYNAGFGGFWDEVVANTAASSDADWTASEATSTQYSAESGKWRLPSVTDWRYVIEGIGDHTSATNPKGIMDYDGIYPGHDTSGLHNGPSSRSSINSYCGNNSLKSIVYWTSSKLAGSSPIKVWRCDFAYGYYVWNEQYDQARIRLVLAY